MIKKFIVSLSLVISMVSFAQQGTSSPYSYYGIGDVRFKGTIENSAMGGISVLPDSIHLNLQNPAMYAALKRTTFAVGGTFSYDKLHSNTDSDKARRTSIDYLAVGLPFKKLTVSFGLVPYSSVGYNVMNTTTYNSPPDGTVTNVQKYQGSGGLNKVFIGTGFYLSKKLSFGLDAQYNFGKIQTISSQTVSNLQYPTIETNYSYISGVNFKMGLSYQTKINKKYSWFSSATFVPENKLQFRQERHVIVSTDTEIPVDTYKINMAQKYSFGSGFGVDRKWMIGAELTMQNANNFGKLYNNITNLSFEKATRLSVGGYYIPNYASFTKFFKRVVYRGGFRYENTGLVISNQSIKDQAITFGLGMPLKNAAFTNLNFGFEVGSKGTTSASLVKENYINFSIGLSFSDKWFIQRKYD